MRFIVIVERRLPSDERLGKYGISVTPDGPSDVKLQNRDTEDDVSQLLMGIGVPKSEVESILKTVKKNVELNPHGPGPKRSSITHHRLDPASVKGNGF